MNGREHFAFGLVSSATAVALGTQFGTPVLNEYQAITISFAAIGSLLPDADTTESIIGKFLYPVAWVLERVFGHRTITHDLMLALPAFIISYFVGNQIFFGLMLGIMSHLFLDGLTRKGIVFNYFKNRKYLDEIILCQGRIHFLPKGLRCRSGSIVSVIETYALCGLCYLLISNFI